MKQPKVNINSDEIQQLKEFQKILSIVIPEKYRNYVKVQLNLVGRKNDVYFNVVVPNGEDENIYQQAQALYVLDDYLKEKIPECGCIDCPLVFAWFYLLSS